MAPPTKLVDRIEANNLFNALQPHSEGIEGFPPLNADANTMDEARENFGNLSITEEGDTDAFGNPIDTNFEGTIAPHFEEADRIAARMNEDAGMNDD